MRIQRTYNCFPIVFAAIIGIAAAAILYFVEGAALDLLFWIGLGIAVLLLIAMLFLSIQSGRYNFPIQRCISEDGGFFIVSIIGTIITAAFSLALTILLVPTTTVLPMLILIFLFGFFFGGMLLSLLFILLSIVVRSDRQGGFR